MSIDNNCAVKLQAPYSIRLAQSLTKTERDIITTHLRLLPSACIKDIALNEAKLDDAADFMRDSAIVKVKNLVDGRQLACPMPLLKTKVALRTVANGEALYVLATDPNSQTDIMAFCQQTQHKAAIDCLEILVNQQSSDDASQPPDASAAVSDTIFHFIITKTDSN